MLGLSNGARELMLLAPQADASVEGYDEDCLCLNVWTPDPNTNRKRPVMFWCHGGGFAAESGTWPWVYGENLARRGDVVVVTINHRLNLFGYLNLAEVGGERYASSGNVGMLDIVAVLEWVRDNIANFGGDPGNVTIFGQSGGGGKVATLMAMPSAKGLFHRAIAMSGSNVTGISRDAAAKGTQAFLATLQLKSDQVDQLQKLPAADLLKENRKTLTDKVAYWTGVRRPLIKNLVESIVTRVGELGLLADVKNEAQYITEITAYATAMAMNYLTRGKFIQP